MDSHLQNIFHKKQAVYSSNIQYIHDIYLQITNLQYSVIFSNKHILTDPHITVR